MAKKQSLKKNLNQNDIERKQEGNLFDKTFKEISEKVFLTLVEERLGIKIKSFRPLKEKMQRTIEREMDFFYEVITEDDDKFILHMEFESGDNLDMVYRVGEYHGIELRRKKLKIRHVVVYLGTELPKMRTQLKPEEIYTGFELINVHALKTEELLSSQIPDTVLIAVLADYPPEQTESILRLIVRKLKALSQNESELSVYFSQLITFSRLRKIEELTIKITEEMPITYDIETDYLYKKGIEKGVERTNYQKSYGFVHNLLLESDFSDEKIARIAGVEIAFVQKVKADMSRS